MPWRLNDDPRQYRQRTRSLLEVRSLGHLPISSAGRVAG